MRTLAARPVARNGERSIWVRTAIARMLCLLGRALEMKTIRMRKHLSPWLIGSAIAMTPAFAHAEDEPKAYSECVKVPTESETAAAKGAYQAGNASFDE